jgi:tRNA(fMet)-specific endonuclease VapC
VTFLLDTDHLTVVQLRAGQSYLRLLTRMQAFPAGEFAASVVSLHEMFLGAHSVIIRARKATDLLRGYRLLARTLQLFSETQTLDFDTSALAEFDRLKQLKLRTGTMDLRIASIALSNGLTLLTGNLRDFQGIPGLVVENWLS